jgi:hypothetical protein
MKKSIPAVFIVLAGAAFLGSTSSAVAQPKSPPEVRSVLPFSNILLAKGASVIITLQGANFVYVSSARLVREGESLKTTAMAPSRLGRGVNVSLFGPRTATTLGLFVEAPWSTPDELYVLRPVGRSSRSPKRS